MGCKVLHSGNLTKFHMKKLSIVVLGGIAFVGIPPTTGDAQTRNQLAVEATPIHGTISYARGPATDVRAGFEVGFGFPQIDISLAPNGHEFVQIAPVGAFARFAAAKSVQLDLGLRAGFSDIRDLGADDF